MAQPALVQARQHVEDRHHGHSGFFQGYIVAPERNKSLFHHLGSQGVHLALHEVMAQLQQPRPFVAVPRRAPCDFHLMRE
jgi:hypothetical protein